MSKVIGVDGDGLTFDDGHRIYSDHDQDCCESHWLDFSGLSLADFAGMEFDLSGDKFFERVEDFGIRLIPINGHALPVPGYGINNGYYGDNIDLVVDRISTNGECEVINRFDVTECQSEGE